MSLNWHEAKMLKGLQEELRELKARLAEVEAMNRIPDRESNSYLEAFERPPHSPLSGSDLLALEERLARLESRRKAALIPLANGTAKRQERATALREAIRATLASHPAGLPPMTAKTVYRALERSGYSPLPSLRCTAFHLTALHRERETQMDRRVQAQ